MQDTAVNVMSWLVYCEQHLAFKLLIGMVISVEQSQRCQTAIELNNET